MKKIAIFFILCLPFFNAFSQGGEIVLPKSWTLEIPINPEIINLPPLNLEQLAAEDAVNDLDKTLPYRYGVSRSIVIDMNAYGLWTDLPEVDGKIWRAAIQSQEALNISVNFGEFYLPEGSRLQLYNDNHSDISTTYTSAQNRSNKQLGSWFIVGDIVWLEYFQPNYVTETPELEISGIIHGYRLGKLNKLLGENKGINDSGDCNYDVNCPIGNDFDVKKDQLKKAVALLNLGNGYLCSASLINNSNNDKTPFLLTSNHCLDYSDPAYWSIRFNWVSPNPVCATTEASGDIQTNFTISGAEVKANNSLSDFALVKLLNPIPASWDVVFAGWDRSENNPLFEVGIHHPNGDIMKICRDDSGATKKDANGTKTWLIGGGNHGTGDGWEIGTTESGSSGSPLFNENGRIIGQLYAGEAFCDGVINNKDYDLYGRFGISWDSGVAPEKRLKEWLDPSNSGQLSIETLQNLLNTPDFEQEGDLKIYPNPASNIVTVQNNRYPNLKYEFYNVVGQKLQSGSAANTMNDINVESFVEGIYFILLTDEDSKDSITKKIIIKR